MSKWFPPLLLLFPGFAQSRYIARELKIIWLQRCSLLHNALVRKHRWSGRYPIYKYKYIYGIWTGFSWGGQALCQSGPRQRRSPCLGCLGCLSFPWRCFISQHSPEGLRFQTSSVICWAEQRITFMHSLLWKTRTGSFFSQVKWKRCCTLVPPEKFPFPTNEKWKFAN